MRKLITQYKFCVWMNVTHVMYICNTNKTAWANDHARFSRMNVYHKTNEIPQVFLDEIQYILWIPFMTQDIIKCMSTEMRSKFENGNKFCGNHSMKITRLIFNEIKHSEAKIISIYLIWFHWLLWHLNRFSVKCELIVPVCMTYVCISLC